MHGFGWFSADRLSALETKSSRSLPRASTPKKEIRLSGKALRRTQRLRQIPALVSKLPWLMSERKTDGGSAPTGSRPPNPIHNCVHFFCVGKDLGNQKLFQLSRRLLWRRSYSLASLIPASESNRRNSRFTTLCLRDVPLSFTKISLAAGQQFPSLASSYFSFNTSIICSTLNRFFRTPNPPLAQVRFGRRLIYIATGSEFPVPITSHSPRFHGIAWPTFECDLNSSIAFMLCA